MSSPAKAIITRRHFLKVNTINWIITNTSPANSETIIESEGIKSGSTQNCPECEGAGVLACDTCGGVGKWRAINRKKFQNTYSFVECPRCFGKGVRVCGVCLGSGSSDVR